MRDKYLFVPFQISPFSTHLAIQTEVAHLFDVNKRARKRRSDDALAELRRELAAAGDFNARHAALHKYEKAHLTGGGDWNALANRLRIATRNLVDIVDNGTPNRRTVYSTKDGQRIVIGHVYLGDGRFEPLGAQPLGNNPTIYERRGKPGRHFIRLNDGTFVRRFVTRGLNGTDGMNLSLGQPLQSVVNTNTANLSEIASTNPVRHPLLANAVMTEQQQILSHTRGWGGNKRYISTGVSNRPAFSTRGTEFTSVFGVVTVDLAGVPVGQIFDVHRLDHAQQQIGVTPQAVATAGSSHPGVAGYAQERFLAMRDVIRTRELLVKTSIPAAAVRAQSVGRVLIGIGSTGGSGVNSAHGRIQGRIAALNFGHLGNIVNEEHQTFRATDGLRWHFVEFSTAQAAMLVYAQLAPVAGQRKVRFNKYRPIRPGGMT